MHNFVIKSTKLRSDKLGNEYMFESKIRFKIRMLEMSQHVYVCKGLVDIEMIFIFITSLNFKHNLDYST